jgi:hypothetical protein
MRGFNFHPQFWAQFGGQLGATDVQFLNFEFGLILGKLFFAFESLVSWPL